MTELAKFLTFLSDDERAAVLERVGAAFDACEAEDELAAALVSPLKLTVELSRTHSQSGLEGTLSRIDELASYTPSAETAVGDDVPAEQISIEELVIEDAPVEEASAEHAPVAETVEEETEPEETVETPAEAPAAPFPQFTPPAEAEAAAEEIIEEEEAESDAPPVELFRIEENGEVFIDTEPKEYFEGADIEADIGPRTEYRAKTGVLAVYIIAAVPLGLIGLVLILALSVAAVAAAVSVGAAGAFSVSLLGAGLALFSDIVMAIGVALVCLAFALVLLWLGLWGIAWGLAAFVRAVIALARKWCYKEVPLQ